MADKDEQRLLSAIGIKPYQSRVWIEPAIIFVLSGWFLSSSIVPNHLLKQRCIANGYDLADCVLIAQGNGSKEIEEKVQPQVAMILMTNTLLSSVVAGLVALLLGPWSDIFGRKKMMSINFSGYAVALASLSVVTILSDYHILVNPWFYVIPYVFIALTGGFSALILSVYCFVTEITSEENRSFRLTTVEVTIFTGVIAGTASCSFLLEVLRPSSVFLISTLLASIAAIYVTKFLQESVDVSMNSKDLNPLAELVSPAALIGMFTAVFKHRFFNDRMLLWIVIFIIVGHRANTTGSFEVYFLFVREKFSWNLQQSTLYESTSLLITILGSFFGLFALKKLLKIRDASIAAIAIASFLADSLLRTFAQNATEMYIASAFALFKMLLPPVCRSLISSIIPKNEVGKVFTFVSLAESATSLVLSPLYIFVYTNTLKIFPGAFYLVTAAACVINLILIFVFRILKHNRDSLISCYAPI